MSTSSKSTKAQLLARIAELESSNAALEARLVIARTSFKAQRALNVALESKLATRGVVATTPVVHTIAPIVTRFTKADGSVWEKARVGNRATLKELVGYHA